MLTEVAPTSFSIVVNGATIHSNIPSRNIAEALVLQLGPGQREAAVIVPTTTDGRQVLFG